MKKILSALLLSSFLFTACGNKDKGDTPDQDNGTADTVASADAPARSTHQFTPERPFEEETGVIKYEYTGDYRGTQTRYWKDHGRTQRIEDDYMNLNSPVDNEVKQVIIITPDEYYYIDRVHKMGYHVDLRDTSGEFRDNMLADFARLGIERTMSKNGYQPNGKLTISNKECVVYKDGESEFCFWNGMNIRTDMKLGSVNYSLNAVEIEEDLKVKDDLFTPPSDIDLPEYEEFVKQQTRGKL